MKGRPSGLAASTQSYQKRNLKISRNIKSFVGSLDRNIGAPKYNSISFEIFHLVGLLYCSAGLKKSAFWEENSWFTSIQALPQAQSSAQSPTIYITFQGIQRLLRHPLGWLWRKEQHHPWILRGDFRTFGLVPFKILWSLFIYFFKRTNWNFFFFFFNLWNFSFVLFTGVWQPWPTGVAPMFKLSFFFTQIYTSIFTVNIFF